MKQSDIEVEYLDHQGSDLSVVNAARVSMDKFHEDFDETADTRLISYLAKHKHETPFRHTHITVRCKAPIWLARQLVKHSVGGSWNEVSRRYVSSEPEFWFPEFVQERPDNVKQGALDEAHPDNLLLLTSMKIHTECCLATYTGLLEANVAPELARCVLPQNTMTEWWWSGSLLFFHRVYKQRIDAHAQKGAREFAEKLEKQISHLYPVSWKALNDNA